MHYALNMAKMRMPYRYIENQRFPGTSSPSDSGHMAVNAMQALELC